MMTTPIDRRGPSPAGSSGALAAALADQSRCWAGGGRAFVEDHLARQPSLRADDEAVLDLIYHEVLLRRRAGEDPGDDEYRRRFPELSGPIGRLFEVDSALAPEESTIRPLSGGHSTWDVAGPMGPAAIPDVPGFEIEAILGRGGMGVVYRARERALNRTVALKMILAGDLATPEQLERFRAEAEAAARLQHPHIVQIHSVGEHGGRPFLVLEFVAGESLAAALGGIPRPAREAARLVAVLAQAVHHAHGRGIIHRDLKPSNVLLAPDGTPKVADFGLAKFLDGAAEQTDSGAILGTPSYMAPEQAGGGSRRIGPPTDVYALGAILYEAVTGRPPFRAESSLDTLHQVLAADVVPPRRLVPKLPRDLETIALKCLEKEPARRYASAVGLADDLRRFLAGATIAARPVGRRERLWRWTRRNPTVAGLSAAVAGLLIVLLAGLTAGLMVLRHQQAETFRHLGRAQLAEHDARQKLWDADLARARAGRWSGRPGQRFDGLRALAEAAGIDAAPALRDEAIACMALADVRPAERLPIITPDTYSLFFDPAFTRYVRSDAMGNLSVRRVIDDREIAVLPGPGHHAYDFDFSDDGRFLVAIYHEVYVLRIWDLERGRSFQVEDPICWDLSPDGRRVAIGHKDGTVRVHDTETGRVDITWDVGHECGRLAFQPGGGLLACVSRQETGVLRFYDSRTGGDRTPPGLPAGWGHATWHPGGRDLVGMGPGLRIRVLDTRTWAIRVLVDTWPDKIGGLIFSPDGRMLAGTGWDSTLRAWDYASGRRLFTLDGAMAFAQFRADGARLSGTRDGRLVELWELESAPEYRTVADGMDGRSVAFSPDGRLLATAGGKGVRIRDPSSLEELAVLPEPNSRDARFEPSGGAILTCGYSGVRRRSLAPDPEVPGGIVIGPAEPLRTRTSVWDIDVTPGGDVLAMADRGDGLALLLGPGRGPPAAVDVKNIATVALSPDGRWLATGNHFEFGSGSRVWATATGRLERSWDEIRESRSAFSPDGRWLVISAADGVSCRRVGTWEPGPRVPQGRASTAPGPLAFSADGSILALSSSLHEVYLVDTGTWGLLARLQAPDAGEVRGLALSPDGTSLAAACNGLLAVWDLGLVRRRLATMGLARDEGAALALARPRSTSTSPAVRIATPPWSEPAARGDREARAGRWDRAAAALAAALERGDPEPDTRFRLALVRLRLDDLDGYRRLCESILPRELSRDSNGDLTTAWVCSLGPRGVDDPARTTRLVDEVLRRVPDEDDSYRYIVRGGALYRAGRYEEAIRCFRWLDEKGAQLPFCRLMMAMALERRGEHNQAVRWLGRCPHSEADDNPEQFWWSQEVAVLRREAEALILDPGFPGDAAEIFRR